ncbi:uncharacterized protein TM35_000232620 [Trypanosoma theileri]|uniref:RanBP2-type domain-containing protein n=1 Tax=Trypanosoma theileri TaxID=67003 RepID=A0A1X0NRR5_9TRYP|nr:uncharacterized protein TM35_000232620 [Trypanosoma theileri]ORC87291.1 hypothetical protein TM35_000232620 [Trypanosoma theileri]
MGCNLKGGYSFLQMFSCLRRTVAMTAVCMGQRRHLHRTTARSLFARMSGDWKCTCGFSNFASRTMCFQCHRVRPTHHRGVDDTRSADVQHVEFKKGDWVCTCGTHNFARREMCLTCGAGRPGGNREKSIGGGGGGGVSGKIVPGDWICEKCNTHNFRGRKECLQCSCKPTITPNSSGIGEDTSATTVTVNNNKGVRTPPWTCLTCHTVNLNNAKSCEVCGAVYEVSSSTSKPASSQPSSSQTSSSTTRPNDWKCDQCGFINFASRVKCKNCKTVSPLSESANDPSLWVCECGYKNFRDRESCRECGNCRTCRS